MQSEAVEREPELRTKNNSTVGKPRGRSCSTVILLNGDEPEEEKIDQEISNDIPSLHIFRFATKVELLLIILGAVTAIGRGPAFLILVILYSNLLNTFIHGGEGVQGVKPYGTCNATEIAGERSFKSSNIMNEAINYSIGVGILGVVCILMDFVFVASFNIVAEKLVIRLRSAYIQALLKQDIGWYDMRGPNFSTSQLSEDLFKIQDGIGEKLGLFLFYLSTFVSSIVGAFCYGWKLSIVIFAILPVISLSTSFLNKVQIRLNGREIKVYSGATGLAEEVISAIKTVKIFNTPKSELENFKSSLKPALRAGIRKGLLTGIGSGMVWAANFSFFALIFWYGIQLVLDSCSNGDSYDAGSLSIILFVALDASYKIGQMLPLLEVFSMARGAAAGICHILNKIPTIDSSSTDGESLSELKGTIRFDQVYFNYPSRLDAPILSGATFQIRAGETVALVGESGCGKSTCLQLLQRFYDPAQGHIEIDGNDVRALNPRWLRDQIGVVSQEPVLFSMTIAENIRFGYPTANQEEVERAARQANAHDFIRMLPMGYETEVGERGAQLSGGQKQRIAIARALIRNPKILLLDEATSALDIHSEVAVQEALLQACQGRTTIIVSHCLPTIRNANRIIVLHHGDIIEEGNHDELMLRKGLYFNQVNSSKIRKKKDHHPISENRFKTTEKAESSTLQESNGESDLKSIKVANQTEEGALKFSIYSLLKLGRAKFSYIILGALGSFMVGLSTPIYAVLYGEVVWLLGQSNFQSFASYQKDYFALLFLGLAFFTGLGSFIEKFVFSLVGEALALKLREFSFEAILNKEVEWFDRPENSVGALCSQLHGDATAVQGATGSRIGLLVQVISSISVSLILSLAYSWKLGLASSLLVPFVLISTIVATKIGMKNQSITDLEQNASRLVSEAVTNIRTVTALGIQEIIHSNYMDKIRKSCEKDTWKSLIRGFIFGLTNNVMFFASIVTYCYGAYLIKNENLPFKTVIVIAEALVFGMGSIGQALAFTSNFGRAKSAGNRLMNLIQSNKNPDPNDHFLDDRNEGKVEFTDVHFSYPNRSNVSVLRGFTALALSGQTVALVGPSGCGKSTCLQLLQRLYNPQMGSISLNDCKIENFSSSAFSHLLAVVPQEPVLFNRTIAENISYGMENVKMEEVISAAKKANIHSFIQSLPLGYETNVGQRGGQLSGGQKQRVAIARALIRNPSILILDEATSALDKETETIVQDALEKARLGRTCIVVSHRLSAFRNVDNIFVMDKGQIVEQGCHSSLINQRGIYYQLWEKSKGK